MKTISLENWDKFIDLERTFYEKNTYESLLGYMSNSNITDNAGYFQNYKKVMENYYNLCRLLEREVLYPEMGKQPFTWEVDFLEREVKISTLST